MILSLLYAACAEAIGLHSLIVFCEGHAIHWFLVKDYYCSESFQDDKSILTKHMASGINEISVVETTLLTNKNATFIDAVKAAENSVQKYDYFRFFIDIQRESDSTNQTNLPSRNGNGYENPSCC